MLDDDMKRVVRAQRLGYVASVCPDGTPNLSPKGTTTVWDDQHLVFLDLHSPQTLGNIEAGNAVVEINVVVMVDVEQASPLVSPAYDDGSTEDEIARRSLNMYSLTQTST